MDSNKTLVVVVGLLVLALILVIMRQRWNKLGGTIKAGPVEGSFQAEAEPDRAGAEGGVSMKNVRSGRDAVAKDEGSGGGVQMEGVDAGRDAVAVASGAGPADPKARRAR